MGHYVYSFEKLEVWQISRKLVKKVYEITTDFPLSEQYGLTSQLRRSAISITANIAEGSSRSSKKDQAHFTQMAYSSLMEVLNHLYLANDLNFISKETLIELKKDISKISNYLNSFRKSQLK